MSKKTATFTRWNKNNIINDYVVYYLTKLKKAADIVFVSGCDLPQNEF